MIKVHVTPQQSEVSDGKTRYQRLGKFKSCRSVLNAVKAGLRTLGWNGIEKVRIIRNVFIAGIVKSDPKFVAKLNDWSHKIVLGG